MKNTLTLIAFIILSITSINAEFNKTKLTERLLPILEYFTTEYGIGIQVGVSANNFNLSLAGGFKNETS